MLARADRTFLWASIVLRLLEESLEGSKMALNQMLTALPEDINRAHEMILQKIPECYQRRTTLISHIIIAAGRPLTLVELKVMLGMIGDDENTTITSQEMLEQVFHPNIGVLIQGYCGSILRIIKTRVYFILATVWEYLVVTAPSLQYTTDHWKHSFHIQESNRILARICTQYLLFTERSKLDFEYIVYHGRYSKKLEQAESHASDITDCKECGIGRGEDFASRSSDIAYCKEWYWKRHRL
jgi:hypothetical protein